MQKSWKIQIYLYQNLEQFRCALDFTSENDFQILGCPFLSDRYQK
jgi:hypothetical protein